MKLYSYEATVPQFEHFAAIKLITAYAACGKCKETLLSNY